MFSKEKNKGVKASQAEDYKLRKEGITALQNSDSCFWSKSYVIIGLTLGFALLDTSVLYNLFDRILDQSSHLGILMAFGIAILINAIALPTAKFIRRAGYGIKRAKFWAGLCIATFLILFFGTCLLRIANADMYEQSTVISSLKNDLSSGEEALEVDEKTKMKAYCTAGFMCIEPLATTLVIFFLSYFHDDELRKKIEQEEIRKIEMEEAIADLKASISSMEANELLLLEEDECARESAIRELRARANKLKSIARKLLAEHLHSAGASSELNHQLIKELEQADRNHFMMETDSQENAENIISDFSLAEKTAV
jgi:hypothetical protein